jgi:hypothetical protein
VRHHRSLLVLALSLGAGSLGAQTPPTAATPPAAAPGAMRAAPSGRATTEVTLMLVDSAARAAAQPAKIRIDHGQPHLRGRTLHTGDLVPYDSLWRTGANEATTLTTDVDLVIGGANIPKGRYVLQTLPGRSGWKLVVQKYVEQPPMEPAPPPDPASDVARIDLRRTTLPTPLESLTFWLIPSTEPGVQRGELRLAWGTVALATDWSVPTGR